MSRRNTNFASQPSGRNTNSKKSKNQNGKVKSILLFPTEGDPRVAKNKKDAKKNLKLNFNEKPK